jgi:tape measure domain-containing protein
MLKFAMAGLIVKLLSIGASAAVATEKSAAVFGVMLHDMDQGAAVVQKLQQTKAAKVFDNAELLDSGRLLFKAGVSAKDLADKTDQLATIAVATSTELADLTRIYQQGANAGSFGLDKINQLAERGVDIYGGLTAATGKSGAELKKMISDGQIGLTEMDAALAHLTEGNGIYAGALQNVAGTAGGMMSAAVTCQPRCAICRDNHPLPHAISSTVSPCTADSTDAMDSLFKSVERLIKVSANKP